jgi:hypothetical protein
LAERLPAPGPDAACWWENGYFCLRTGGDPNTLRDILFENADRFVRSLQWVSGFGTAEQGTFIAGEEIGNNPFISLAENGADTSPFKTFSGQVDPGEILRKQQKALALPKPTIPWLSHPANGVASWKFDCSVGSHAYDLGFSSNDEGSGDQNIFYPAIELLGITGAAFFLAVQALQAPPESGVVRNESLQLVAWSKPISFNLVPFAAAGLVTGISGRTYRIADRGAAYGKGGAYRYFPEAILESITP